RQRTPSLLDRGPARGSSQQRRLHLRPGDLFGTGTISAPGDGGLGSLLEISAGGGRPVELASRQARRFLEDGDSGIMRARCAREGFATMGLGECRGTIAAAI